MSDVLDQLRAADPVPDPPRDGAEADALLASILARPRKPPRRRRTLPRAAVAVAGLACALAILLVALGGGGDSLADRAYAATAPGRSVVHELVVTDWREPGSTRRLGTERLEAWYHPADGRARRLYDEHGDRVDIVVPAHGVLRLRGSDAGPLWTENPDPGFRRKNATDFLHEFRQAYKTGTLERTGHETFAGRDTVAYRVKAPDGVTEERWYVDPKTAVPLGSTRLFAAVGEPAQLVTRRLMAYERLPSTPQNLKLLRAPR